MPIPINTDVERLIVEIKKGVSEACKRPLYDVVCDESNNSQEDIDNNILNMTIHSLPVVATVVVIPSKIVVCYRCLKPYNQNTAPLRKTKNLSIKEKSCPECGCKLYFS